MSINTTTVYHSPTTTAVSSISNSTFYTELVVYINSWRTLSGPAFISLIFIVILTILGNTLVLVATWRERSLHQPNKYFIACLAVADLLVGLFVALARLSILIVQLKIYELNIHLCRFLVWMDTVSLAASIYTLTLISFDRYLKISKPLQYKSRMTTSRSLKIIFFIWLISSSVATYSVTPDSGSVGILNVVGGLCKNLNGNFTRIKIFYIFLSVGVFFLPTIIIVIMYTLIFVVAHKRRKMLRNGEMGQTNNDENQRTTFLKDLKVIRMLLIVVGVFIFCWGPYFIFLLLFYHDGEIFLDISFESFQVTFSFLKLLPLFNSVCNPIIYACLDQTYKQAFKRLFRRMMCRPNSSHVQPSDAVELRQIRTRQHNEL